MSYLGSLWGAGLGRACKRRAYRILLLLRVWGGLVLERWWFMERRRRVERVVSNNKLGVL